MGLGRLAGSAAALLAAVAPGHNPRTAQAYTTPIPRCLLPLPPSNGTLNPFSLTRPPRPPPCSNAEGGAAFFPSAADAPLAASNELAVSAADRKPAHQAKSNPPRDGSQIGLPLPLPKTAVSGSLTPGARRSYA